MKTELRVFKHRKLLLIIAETEQEKAALDLLCKGVYENDTPKKINGELRSDDYFNPYLSFDV